MTPFPQTIETPRLILRQPYEEIACSLCDYRCTNEYSGEVTNVFDTQNQALKYISLYLSGDIQNNTTFYIFPKKSPTLVTGEVGMIYDNKGIQVTWDIDPRYEGNGYATEAAEAVIQVALQLGAPKVHALIDHENKKSQGVARRLGMRGDYGTTLSALYEYVERTRTQQPGIPTV